jgi:hypothetical protein
MENLWIDEASFIEQHQKEDSCYNVIVYTEGIPKDRFSTSYLRQFFNVGRNEMNIFDRDS